MGEFEVQPQSRAIELEGPEDDSAKLQEFQQGVRKVISRHSHTL